MKFFEKCQGNVLKINKIGDSKKSHFLSLKLAGKKLCFALKEKKFKCQNLKLSDDYFISQNSNGFIEF